MQLKTQCIINFFHCKHGWSSSTHGRHIKLAVITRFTIPAASSIWTYFSYFVTSLLHDFCRQVSRRGKATRNHGFQNSHHENQQTFLTQQTVLFTCSQVAQAITMGPGTTLADRVVHIMLTVCFLMLKKCYYYAQSSTVMLQLFSPGSLITWYAYMDDYIDNIKYKYSFYAELVEESSPLLTLFNVTIFCYTEAWWRLQYSPT